MKVIEVANLLFPRQCDGDEIVNCNVFMGLVQGRRKLSIALALYTKFS